jgi:hypothetical protein
MILEGYGAGPRMIRLIRGFWRDPNMVCHVAGNFSTAFKAGCGATQDGPLFTKLFNILVDAVMREWVWLLEECVCVCVFLASGSKVGSCEA